MVNQLSPSPFYERTRQLGKTLPQTRPHKPRSGVNVVRTSEIVCTVLDADCYSENNPAQDEIINCPQFISLTLDFTFCSKAFFS